MNLLIFAAIAALLLLLKIATVIFGQVRSPLNDVKGPFLARFSSTWYAWKVYEGSFQALNQELHQQYGKFVRYGPNHVSLNDPSAVGIVYGFGKSFPKSPWYKAWVGPGTWSLFTDQDVKHHSGTRKLYQSSYSLSALVNYEAFVDECAGLFSRRLTELVADNKPVNMTHWFQCYAFDVIGMITYGKRLGFLDHGDDVGGIIKALEGFLGYSAIVGNFPSLHPYLYPLRNWWAGSKGAGRQYVVNFTNDRIAEGKAEYKSPSGTEDESATQDFPKKFLIKNAEDPQVFTDYHISTGCVTNMIAGSDTTAISLSAVLYYLLKNPSCMEKLQDEIAAFTAKGELSQFVTFKESQQMPYLQAVFKEALRLHPATGLPLERVVPEGGVTISEQFFPEGTVVGIKTWVAHRDPNIFGQDADSFVPERWLDNDEARVALMNRNWMPFGLGSRTCIGRHISMLEMNKLIPLIVRDFDFSLDGSLKNEAWKTKDYWFVKPENFQVRVQMRK